MNIAVLSDIHGNLEALQAVIADMQEKNIGQVVCLGDLVGYGPDPESVVSEVRQRGYAAVCGNHEAALAAEKARRTMNFQARENNIATASLLSEENLRYCCNLPRALSAAGALFVHGVPPDSVNRYIYMLEDSEISDIFSKNPCRLFFVGHTHQLAFFYERDQSVIREHISAGSYRLEPERQYLINCGSVGQPRDGDRRAKYVIYGRGGNNLTVRAVDYDVETTVRKIIARGFPRAFAERLR